MWGQTHSAATLKFAILDELRRLGATRMEAHYSGGNDEGGVDDVTVLRPVTEENPAWLVYLHRPNWRQEIVRDSFPSAGPFSSRQEADAAASVMEKAEVEQVTGDFVALLGAEVGDWEHGLYAAVNDLLSLDFGTWAGDFSASGVVYADLNEGRVWREGEISSYTSDESAGEY
jgi:hypothetical protein